MILFRLLPYQSGATSTKNRQMGGWRTSQIDVRVWGQLSAEAEVVRRPLQLLPLLRESISFVACFAVHADAFGGPFFTSWSSGQTLRFTTWTGLTEYAEQFFPSMTPVFGPLDTGSSESTTVSSSGMFTSSTPSSTGSASAQATSVPNSGKVQATSEGVLWIVPMLGLFGLL